MIKSVSIRLAFSLIPLSCCAALCDAATITDTVNFQVSGNTDATGTFTWDTTLDQFDSFTVTFPNGNPLVTTVFDLTNSANSPTLSGPAIGCGTGAQAAFAVLTDGSCLDGLIPGWTVTGSFMPSAPVNDLVFSVWASTSNGQELPIVMAASAPGSLGDVFLNLGGGVFLATSSSPTPTSAPEPGGFIGCFLCGGLGLGVGRAFSPRRSFSAHRS